MRQNKNAVTVSKRLEGLNGQIGGFLVFLSSESVRALESLILKKTRAIKSLMFQVLRSGPKKEGQGPDYFLREISNRMSPPPPLTKSGG